MQPASFGIFDLQDFNAHMIREGFVSEATKGEYEVARYRKYNPQGDDPPVLVYRKKHKNQGFTVCPNDHELNYLIDLPHTMSRKSPQVVGIEAGEAVTSPASAEDAPW